MRVISLKSGGGEIVANDKIKVGLSVRGTGMPPIATQWFEGAGDGANYRGARVLSRVLDLPVKVYGSDRAEVWGGMSLVARVFAPLAGDVVLQVDLGGEGWQTRVRRTGGGDWTWGVDTDGKTFIKTIITIQAGDPYWVRTAAESRTITPGGLGRGLIRTPSPRLHALRVSTNNALGQVEFENPGDVPTDARWIVSGPFVGFTLTSPSGEVLSWNGTMLAGQSIIIDTETGIIVDQTGANRYGGLGPVPKFWQIPAGISTAGIELIDAVSGDGQSDVRVSWNPRKWVLF